MTDQELDARFKTLDDRFETRFQAMDDRFEARFQAMDARFEARFQAMDDRFEHLLKFMAHEFDKVREEFRNEIGALTRRVDYLGTAVHGIQAMLSGLTRNNEDSEAEMARIRGAQVGQQRAIEDLDRRLRRIEEKDGQPPQA